jgi:hypothetical protein
MVATDTALTEGGQLPNHHRPIMQRIRWIRGRQVGVARGR